MDVPILEVVRSGPSSLPAASVTSSKRSILAYGAVCGESKRLRKNALRDYATNVLHMTSSEAADALLTAATTPGATGSITTRISTPTAVYSQSQHNFVPLGIATSDDHDVVAVVLKPVIDQLNDLIDHQSDSITSVFIRQSFRWHWIVACPGP